MMRRCGDRGSRSFLRKTDEELKDQDDADARAAGGVWTETCRQSSDEKVKAEVALQEANDILDFAAKGLEVKDQVIDELQEELGKKDERLRLLGRAALGLRALVELGYHLRERIQGR